MGMAQGTQRATENRRLDSLPHFMKEFNHLKLGVNRHPNNWRLSEGQQFQTNNHGTVTVVEFKSATDVVVKFEDGGEEVPRLL